MRYCKRCCYPENAKPNIIFDEQGICSGCRYIERKVETDWEKREKMLRALLEEYKQKAKDSGNPYDCLIPVSGGKDSHFQAYLMKKVYGMNPLLVTFNHAFNTEWGIRNLTNMLNQFNCDLLRFTINPESIRKITRYMLKKLGDITWHYHAGIMTFPIQIAVKYNIPLVVWGEESYSDLVGMFRNEDIVEFSKKVRQEHDMRGFEPEDILRDSENKELTKQDLAAFFYPSEEEIERVGVRGIYISNFIRWKAKEQVEMLIKDYGFETSPGKERTFNIHAKIDDAANDVHDYLKYLKFGYGRATDDASYEIRHGRMTREEGIEMVRKYDSVRPKSLDAFLKFLGMTENEFKESIEHLRDEKIWEKKDGIWQAKDSVVNHIKEQGVEEARIPQSEERTSFIASSKKTPYSRGSGDEFVLL